MGFTTFLAFPRLAVPSVCTVCRRLLFNVPTLNFNKEIIPLQNEDSVKCIASNLFQLYIPQGCSRPERSDGRHRRRRAEGIIID